MLNVIGNSPSAKFIFFAMDDLSKGPDEKDIKRLLDAKRVNLYLRNGHYRESFNDISDYLYIQKMGFYKLSNWNANGFTHVARLDSECDLNAMIELKYGHTAIGYLHLTMGLLSELRELLRDRENLINQITRANREKDTLIRSLESIRELPHLRTSHLVPSDSAAQSIFTNYCDTEIALLKSRFDDWHHKSKWNPLIQEEPNQLAA